MTDAAQTPPQTVPPDAPRIHLDFLDGMRAVAALLVASSHTGSVIWHAATKPAGWENIVLEASGYNRWPVCVFIVLSGFCLMLPVVKSSWTLRGGAKRFFLRRARRILPPYYFAVGLSLLLIWIVLGEKTGTGWDLSAIVTPRSILTHLLLIHNLFKNENNPLLNDYAQINYPLWSVAVEWQIYFTFPLLLWMWRRLGGWAATIITVFFSYVMLMLLRATPLVGLTPQFLGLFAMGMLGAAIAFSPEPSWQRVRERVPWSGLLLVMGGLLALTHSLPNKRLLDFPVGVATVCALVAMARPGRNRLRAVFEARPLVAVGRFSYSLYLMHAPLLQVLWLAGFRNAPGGTLGQLFWYHLAGLPLIVGASYLFFLAFERPFLNTRHEA